MITAPLRPKGTLRDLTAKYLTELIVSGQLSAGEYLPREEAITRRLGVSRTAYREALCRLEAQGLVDVIHGVGTRVGDRSREVVAESLALLLQRERAVTVDLLEARRLIETETAALAAERATESDIAALDEALDAMRRPTSLAEEYVASDLRLHLALAHASHNAVLTALVESMRHALFECIAATFEAGGRTERRLRDHERILETIRVRDVEGARRAVATHLEATEAMLGRIGWLAPPPPSTPTPTVTFIRPRPSAANAPPPTDNARAEVPSPS